MAASSNFAFLQEHDPVFLQLASTAEQVFASDPNTTLIKLRQLGYRLVYNVSDNIVTVTVLAVGESDKNKVYDLALSRLKIDPF